MAEADGAPQQPHLEKGSPSRPPQEAVGVQGDGAKAGEGAALNGVVIAEGARSEKQENDKEKEKETEKDGEKGVKAGEAETVKARARPNGKVVHMARADLVNLADLDRALDRALSRRDKPAAGAPSTAAVPGNGEVSAVAVGESQSSDADKLGHGPQAEGTARPEWEVDVKNVVLRKRVAQGTFGTVYRGTYRGKDVAVKVLDWGEEDTMSRLQLDRLRKAFKQEVTVWSTLTHPNIAQFVGASVADQGGFMIPSFDRSKGGRKGDIRLEGSLCCLIVEFVAGGTLKDFLIANRRKKLPLRTVVQLASDMAKGLEYLHANRVVHRDIKSENMLLTPGRRVKVADFGVARIEAENPKDMTGATGTLGYMAPEVLDCRPYNHLADVYSFGICLWEIYCCDMPFPDLDFKEMAAVVNKGLRPTIPGICPRDLGSIMRRCWDADPKKRPDMGEVVQLLGKVDLKRGKGMTPIYEMPNDSISCCWVT